MKLGRRPKSFLQTESTSAVKFRPSGNNVYLFPACLQCSHNLLQLLVLPAAQQVTPNLDAFFSAMSLLSSTRFVTSQVFDAVGLAEIKMEALFGRETQTLRLKKSFHERFLYSLKLTYLTEGVTNYFI